LNKLPDDVQEVLRMAAVLGREFDYEVLIGASEFEEDDIIDAIEMADSAQMVKEGREDTLFEFVHALVPQSIRENTHRLRLRKLHKRAAAAYEKVRPENYESLAYHYSEGGDDAEALRYYMLAGERALANFANQDAENDFTAALNLTEDRLEQAKLLSQLGEAQNRLSRHSEAVESRLKSADLYLKHSDKDHAAEKFALASRSMWQTGETQAALDICREGLKAVGDTPDGPGLARLYSETARECYFNGVRDEVEQFASRALEMAEEFELLAVRADTLITLATYMGTASSEAVELFQEAIEIAESNDLIREAMRGNNNFGVLHSSRGDYQRAIENYQRASELARRTGRASQQVFFTNNVIWSQMLLGQVEAADDGYSSIEPLVEELPDPELGARMLRGSKGFRLFQAGDFDAANKMIDQSIEEERSANDIFSLENSLNGKSSLLLIAGELREAERVLQEAIEVALKLGEGEFQHLFASIVESLLGEVDSAEAHMKSALKIIGDSEPVFWRQLNLLRAEAHLLAAREEWALVWSKFDELHTVMAEKEVLGLVHWFRTEWADSHVRRGEPEDIQRAKELFKQARSDSEAMGATGWVELIDGKIAKLPDAP